MQRIDPEQQRYVAERELQLQQLEMDEERRRQAEEARRQVLQQEREEGRAHPEDAELFEELYRTGVYGLEWVPVPGFELEAECKMLRKAVVQAEVKFLKATGYPAPSSVTAEYYRATDIEAQLSRLSPEEKRAREAREYKLRRMEEEARRDVADG